MNAIDCLKGRRSVREFTEESVSHELLEEIIEVARFAPSWKNTQISRYVALEGAKKDELADCAFAAYAGNANMVKKAPMVIALTYIKNRSGFERDGSYSTPKKTDGRISIPVLPLRLFVLQLTRKISEQLFLESSMKTKLPRLFLFPKIVVLPL